MQYAQEPTYRAPLLAAATAFAALMAIFSSPWALNQPWMNALFKPLATLAVIAYAWPRGKSEPAMRRWVLVGLGFSWLGDVALLWPERGFLPGLVSFLLAHLAYLWAFSRPRRLAVVFWPFLLYAGVAGAILWQLWPGVLAALRTPVVAYVVCLAAMAAQAAALWRAGWPGGGGLALGGALFVLSDALLATNKFAGPLPLASLWVLTSYWAAQWMIARALPAPQSQATYP